MSTTTTEEIDLAELEQLRSAHDQIREQIASRIVGQDEVVEQLLMAVFARGHCILEGVPGLAKTLMVHSLAQSLSLDFNRIQFTPDLMPSDITGTEVLYEDRNSGARELRFVQGPIFANLILADEINRTPPKTQAALLEAMQERQVTAGGHRHALPEPFFVLATQNPIEQEGTYPLPEAQLDRFLFKIFITYPTPDEERRIYRLTTGRRRARDRADADRRPDRGLAARGAEGARVGPLHRLRDGPGPRDPRAGARRAGLHRRIGHLGRRAPGGPVADPGGQGAGRAGRPAERLGRRHPRHRAAGAPPPDRRQLQRPGGRRVQRLDRQEAAERRPDPEGGRRCRRRGNIPILTPSRGSPT